MENIQISKEKLVKIKDYILFGLLFLWMIMPAIQTIKVIYKLINLENIYFTLMKITGVVGIAVSIIMIYCKIKNAENKKNAIKGLLPIFLFVLYMIWTYISCLNSPYKRTAFYGSFYRQEGYYMYINYAGYFLCAFLLENKKLRKILLNTFIIVTVFLVSISKVTANGERFTNIFVNTQTDTTVFAHHNHYAYYLMMALMCSLGLFLKEKNKVLKVLYIIAFSLIGYMLIYNDTLGCYLATSIIFILYSIYSLIKKKDRMGIFIAIFIFVILSCLITKEGKIVAYENIKSFANDFEIVFIKITGIQLEDKKKMERVEVSFKYTGTSRMELWTNGIDFILERPLLGYGPDNLKPKYADVGISQDRPHNLIIQLATTSGIPGMVLYVLAVGIIVVIGIKKFLKNNENGKIFLIIILAYLISAMFGNSMYYTSPYFFIFLGSLMNINLIKEEQ